jgi:hypothetical protein
MRPRPEPHFRHATQSISEEQKSSTPSHIGTFISTPPASVQTSFSAQLLQIQKADMENEFDDFLFPFFRRWMKHFRSTELGPRYFQILDNVVHNVGDAPGPQTPIPVQHSPQPRISKPKLPHSEIELQRLMKDIKERDSRVTCLESELAAEKQAHEKCQQELRKQCSRSQSSINAHAGLRGLTGSHKSRPAKFFSRPLSAPPGTLLSPAPMPTRPFSASSFGLSAAPEKSASASQAVQATTYWPTHLKPDAAVLNASAAVGDRKSSTMKKLTKTAFAKAMKKIEMTFAVTWKKNSGKKEPVDLSSRRRSWAY